MGSFLQPKWIGLWPGLASLWYRGEVVSLLWVAIFGAALNVAILSTFHWEGWLSFGVWILIWLGVSGSSLMSLVYTTFTWPKIRGVRTVSDDHNRLFREAQQFYLRGEYFEAEALLQRIFNSGQPDVEAALMMVSILRRTRRWVQALYCIDRLMLLERASVWSLELQSERRRVQQAIEDEQKKGRDRDSSDEIAGLISLRGEA